MTAFLWPKGSYHFGSLLHLTGATLTAIEAALAQLFHDGQPVVVSSGRAGLAMTLEAIGLSRPDLVRVPPYASHCVLEAVARVATPLPAAATAGPAAHVIYHQWGYVQSRPNTNAELIEDACDTLCRPGARLFPLGGRFELWSLPKILGCSGGGIIWCRNADDAERLRHMREMRSNGATVQWLMRVLATATLNECWEGREAGCGYLPRLAAADVIAAIERWSDLLARRRARLALLEPYLPAWLATTESRIPCVVPVHADAALERKIRAFGITTGLRHFERVMPDGSAELVITLPLPIHQDIEMETLHKMLQILGSPT